MWVTSKSPLAGVRVAITRPVGTGGGLARRVRALGGAPLSLPGFSLRAAADADAARVALRDALACNVAIFSSPAAVRFARRLVALRTRASVYAPGRGTARALQRAGIHAAVPATREHSEGVLAMPALRDVRGQRIGMIGAPGGRGLLERELALRGAAVVQAYVYRRLPARLDRRHLDALQRNERKPLYVLLTSAGALDNLLEDLPTQARRRFLLATAVVSSERLAAAARMAGCARILRAASPHADALLAAIAAERG